MDLFPWVQHTTTLNKSIELHNSFSFVIFTGQTKEIDRRSILLVQEFIKPPEHLVVPFQTVTTLGGCSQPSDDVPVAMVKHPMVFIWEDNQSTRDALPRDARLSTSQQE